MTHKHSQRDRIWGYEVLNTFHGKFSKMSELIFMVYLH